MLAAQPLKCTMAAASRPTSRWVDREGRSNNAMDGLMRSVHSGVAGNPLDRVSLHNALQAPVVARAKPPSCSSESYRVLGREDPFKLNAEDEDAFAMLDAPIRPISKAP